MSRPQPWSIDRLGPLHVAAMRDLLRMFGDAFEDHDTYCGNQPEDSYLAELLSREEFITLVCRSDAGEILGGLCAYTLPKFEQVRSEIYIYDLAVGEPFRRQGIASALIASLGKLADRIGAHAVFVQADMGDDEAVALYSKHGPREDVHHFDVWTRP